MLCPDSRTCYVMYRISPNPLKSPMYGTYKLKPSASTVWYGTTMNPIKVLRHHLGLTQVEFAQKIGVHRQTILDLEAGLFPIIPSSVRCTLPSPVEKYDVLYRNWVKEQRWANKDRFAVNLSSVESFQDYVDKVGGSTRGFCRVLIIQTSIVRDYIANGERWGMVESALIETGMPTDFIVWLGGLPRG